MKPMVYLTEYELDSTIEVLNIDLKYPTGGYTNEVELPDDVIAICRYQVEDNGDLNRIEIINPTVFIESPETDTVEIKGYNVKQLISDLFAKYDILASAKKAGEVNKGNLTDDEYVEALVKSMYITGVRGKLR